MLCVTYYIQLEWFPSILFKRNMTNPDRPTQLLCFPAYKKDSKISENIMEVSIFTVSKHFPHFLCVETMTRKWFIMTNKSVCGAFLNQ